MMLTSYSKERCIFCVCALDIKRLNLGKSFLLSSWATVAEITSQLKYLEYLDLR